MTDGERASLVSQIQISKSIGTSSKWFLEFEFEFEFEWDIQKTRKILLRKIQDLSKWRAHQLESFHSRKSTSTTMKSIAIAHVDIVLRPFTIANDGQRQFIRPLHVGVSSSISIIILCCVRGGRGPVVAAR